MENQSKPRIFEYLSRMVQLKSSDLFLTAGVPTTYRVRGELVKDGENKNTDADIAALIKEMLTEDQWMEYNSTMELNVGMELDDKERFRINMFYQQRKHGLVARHVKSEIPTFEELGLPQIYKEFISQKRGLFLMVGATGSGKSSSVASMLEHRNNTIGGHILTIEDPIEFVFKPKKSIFTQREINIDTFSYASALRNALRQNPDVMFIGEIRDRESMESALSFSETGHLVIATLHANNAAHTFERVISFYPEESKNQIIVALAHNLSGICAQRLIKTIDGNVALIYEILINKGLITENIKEKKFTEIRDVMIQNLDNGMMTFDECLFRLFKARVIDRDIAIKESDNPNNLRLRLAQYSDTNLSKSLKGAAKTSLDSNYIGEMDMKDIIQKKIDDNF